MSEKKINTHGDHVASCLCCEHFELSPDMTGYNVGLCFEAVCYRGKFFPRQDLISERDLHFIMENAVNCSEFEAIGMEKR